LEGLRYPRASEQGCCKVGVSPDNIFVVFPRDPFIHPVRPFSAENMTRHVMIRRYTTLEINKKSDSRAAGHMAQPKDFEWP
jgi:hypothetical protein